MSWQSDLRIGCCGFPVTLARYAETFSVVEVQQTFYQPPQLRTLQKWRSQTSPQFEFTLKAWQLITHEASSPTCRRLREKLNDRQKCEAGAFRASATLRLTVLWPEAILISEGDSLPSDVGRPAEVGIKG